MSGWDGKAIGLANCSKVSPRVGRIQWKEEGVYRVVLPRSESPLLLVLVQRRLLSRCYADEAVLTPVWSGAKSLAFNANFDLAPGLALKPIVNVGLENKINCITHSGNLPQ